MGCSVYEGYFEVGKVKITNEQRKKHISQMSKRERNIVINKLRNLNVYTIKPCYHLLNKDITYDINSIRLTLQDKRIEELIIEYNETKNSKRVLLETRDKFNVMVNGKLETCVLKFVVNLTNNQIVTAFYNRADDNHATLNMSRYDRELIIS